jgi:hypothetical protein
MKKTLLALMGIIILFQLMMFCEKATGKFSIPKIAAALQPETAQIDPVTLEKVNALLKQRFTYFGRGRQSFAFLSEDRSIVIKFAKTHGRSLKELIKQEKEEASYRLAFDRFKDEAGLLYLHLGKTQGLHPKITIVDKLNIAHVIDLDSKAFIIQKRADLLLPSIEKCLCEGRIDKAKEIVSSVIDLLILRNAKGIRDRDVKLHRNLGIKNGKAMLIDVGRLELAKEKVPLREELERNTRKFRQWASEHCPALVDYIQETIQEKSNEKNHH